MGICFILQEELSLWFFRKECFKKFFLAKLKFQKVLFDKFSLKEHASVGKKCAETRKHKYIKYEEKNMRIRKCTERNMKHPHKTCRWSSNQ